MNNAHTTRIFINTLDNNESSILDGLRIGIALCSLFQQVFKLIHVIVLEIGDFAAWKFDTCLDCIIYAIVAANIKIISIVTYTKSKSSFLAKQGITEETVQ